VALDADVGNSTFIELGMKKHPQRSVQCFIAEQLLVGCAQGLACLGFTPVLSSFSCFLTRAFDQLRMNNISQCNLKI